MQTPAPLSRSLDATATRMAFVPRLKPGAAAALMPTRAAVYAFVKAHYKHDRFEGRNGDWCPDCSGLIVDGYMQQLANDEVCCISGFEGVTGDGIWFDRHLVAHPDSAVAWVRERVKA